MRQRCRNPRHHAWASYGGRGIAICAAWDCYDTFVADMGVRPSLDHSIDRINNDGDYEPGNCRWATRSEQRRNQQAFSADRCAQLAQARAARRQRPEAERDQMRRLAATTKLTLRQIGARFGVTASCVSDIVGRRPRQVWRALPDADQFQETA
jgi:hypothetical protein